MRRRFTAIAFMAVISHCALAQPILNSTDILPKVGEQFDFRVFDASAVGTPDTGANVTWDYSGLVSTSTSSIFINSPINLPNGGDYPQANLVLEQDSTYLYYKGNTNTFSLYGFEATNNQAIYTDPDEQLEFPLTYLNTGTDSFAGTFDVAIPNLGRFLSYRTGITTYKVDGYGTLILPNSTFNDVLKVTVTSNQVDSIRLIIFDTLVNSTLTLHQWFVKDIHTPIMTLSETETEIQPAPIFLGNYYDLVVGVEDVKSGNRFFKLSYSPKGDKANLNYRLTYSQEVSISVLDIQGKEVLSLADGFEDKGIHQLSIPTKNLNKGIYLIKGVLGNQTYTEKLLIP